MGMGLFVFSIIILLFIGLAVAFSNAANDDNPLLDYAGNQVSVARMGALGTHLHGLGIGEQITLCLITDTDFLFVVASPEKKTLDQFPFKNLKAIEIQDATQLSKRLTATRLALLGPFALALPKAKVSEKAFLMVEWEDETGLRQAVFTDTETGALSRMDMRANRIRRLLKEVMAEQVKTELSNEAIG